MEVSNFHQTKKVTRCRSRLSSFMYKNSNYLRNHPLDWRNGSNKPWGWDITANKQWPVCNIFRC